MQSRKRKAEAVSDNEQKQEKKQDVVVKKEQREWSDILHVRVVNDSISELFVKRPDTVAELYTEVEKQLNAKVLMCHEGTHILRSDGDISPFFYRCVWSAFKLPGPHATRYTMEVIVKTLSGKNVVLECESSDPVMLLKYFFREKEGVPIDQMRFIYAGKSLDNERTLADYNIQKEATIHMVLTLRGGGGFCASDMTKSLSFGDMKNSSLRKIQFKPTAPVGRQVASGLSLEYWCSNRKCQSYDEWPVICCGGFRGYHLGSPTWVVSPCCHVSQNVVPSTCGFSDCLWHYVGERLDNETGRPYLVRGEWRRTGAYYHRFDEVDKNGDSTKWLNMRLVAVGYETEVKLHDEQTECPVCLESVTQQDFTILQCPHLIHDTCWKQIESYAQASDRQAVCPVCNFE